MYEDDFEPEDQDGSGSSVTTMIDGPASDTSPSTTDASNTVTQQNKKFVREKSPKKDDIYDFSSSGDDLGYWVVVNDDLGYWMLGSH